MTLGWVALEALRILVNKSPIGSLNVTDIIVITKSPTRLCYSWNNTLKGPFPEADTTHAKFTHVGPGPTTDPTTVVKLHLEFRGSFPFFNLALLGQFSDYLPGYAASR